MQLTFRKVHSLSFTLKKSWNQNFCLRFPKIHLNRVKNPNNCLCQASQTDVLVPEEMSGTKLQLVQ